MIKVKTKKKIEEVHEIECPRCGAVLEYYDSDIEGESICCPECEKWINVLDKDCSSHNFPEDFFKFGENYKCTDEEIQKYVNRVHEYLMDSKTDYCFEGTGDTLVIGMKQEDEDMIIVAKNYYQLDYNFRD